jgi:hypothetical protein
VRAGDLALERFGIHRELELAKSLFQIKQQFM